MRVRRVLTRKRAVFSDSVRVVRACARAITHDRFLSRTVPLAVLGVIGVLVSTRLLTHAATAEQPRTWRKPLATGFRLLVSMCLQFVVAAWLTARWREQGRERGRALLRRLGRRAPSLTVAAAITVWFELATVGNDWHTWVRALLGFLYAYLLGYAVPASAVYGVGLFAAVGHSLRALRRTFGADILAWSGLWVVTGLAALLAAVPDAFGLYTNTDSGTRLSLAGRLFSWGVVLPSTMIALALSAAFATVIFFALDTGRTPPGFPQRAVETVSDLQLDGGERRDGSEEDRG